MTTLTPHFRASPEQLQVLQSLLDAKIDEILDSFSISLHKNRKRYWGACCVHNGDNQAAFNIIPNADDDSRSLWWICYTHHCEETFKKTSIGLVRALLSNKEYNWEKPGDKTASFPETLQWCEKFLGISISDLKIDQLNLEKQRFINLWLNKTKQKIENTLKITREEVRKRLIIPSEYFIKRGFAEAILDKYDVGVSRNYQAEMYGRAIAPIYEETGRYLIGCTGRTMFPQCSQCGCYHNGTSCPNLDIRHLYSKWKHNASFDKRNVLYNYWYEAKEIQKTGKVCLVEGPGKVWRIKQAEVKIPTLGLFGNSLSEEQQIILEKSGAMTVFILTDNNTAGVVGRQEIDKLLKRSFNIKHLEAPKEYDGVDDVPTEKVKLMFQGL